jgi:hypothetical protein
MGWFGVSSTPCLITAVLEATSSIPTPRQPIIQHVDKLIGYRRPHSEQTCTVCSLELFSSSSVASPGLEWLPFSILEHQHPVVALAQIVGQLQEGSRAN